MKMTHLDLVQNILSAMGSDEVNSYSDTTESRQVSEIVRTAYFNIIARAQLPEQDNVFRLTASGDALLPVLMYRPDNISKIYWIKYDKSDPVTVGEPEFSYVTILPKEQFLEMTHQFDADDTDVGTMTIDGNIFYFKNDQAPTYCTIIKDYYIIFDSFDEDLESTLQTSKTLCFGQTIPAYTLDDDFTPDLDDKQFPLLLNEAKALAFMELKQTTHELAVQESRRQWRTLQHSKHLKKPNHFDELPDFGRRRR